MSLAQMERFRFVPLAIRPEKGDVVHAGEAAKVARARALDESTKATARGDTSGAALWTGRAASLSKVERVAPGAVGVRWRESEQRIYFEVPNVGRVQSVMVEQFVMEFASTGDDEEIYAMMDRGIAAVFDLVTSWGWTATA